MATNLTQGRCAPLTQEKQDAIYARNQIESSALRLPAELRYCIMEYALSEDEGLHYQTAKGDVPRLYRARDFSTDTSRLGHTFEANQTKYVCRQLHFEAKGLGLKLNDLTFIRIYIGPRAVEQSPSAIEQAIVFLNHLSEQQMKSVRCVNIKTPLSDEGYRRQIDCCSHPHDWYHDDQRSWRIRYRQTVDLLKFSHRYPHITFNVDIALHLHLGWPTRRIPFVVWREITTYLITFRDKSKKIAGRFLNERIRKKEELRFGTDSITLNAPNVRFRLPEP